MRKRFRFSLFLLAALSCVKFSSPSAAATLIIDSSGRLIGATGIDVGGSLYDASFREGTCIALFHGCDEAHDFEFQTQTAALLASQALLDQVLIDGDLGLFDSDPLATFGCEFLFDNSCGIATPYALSEGLFGPTIDVGYTVNRVGFDQAIHLYFGFSITDDTAQIPAEVFAVWTAVPEPGMGLLRSLGLTVLAARRPDARAHA